MPKTKEDMRLIAKISDEILTVADCVGDMPRGDLQGIAEAAAMKIIAMSDISLLEEIKACRDCRFSPCHEHEN
jgi:hypothetical protein